MNDGRRTLAIHLVLAVLTISVYWQTVHFDFVNYDDPPYVTENLHVRAGFTGAGVRWVFTSADTGNWHPLTTLSNMLACELFGLDPAGHHLMNVVLHVGSTLVLFAMLQAATGGTWPSAFVAALFAVHPLHVESVAWVSSRKDPLSALWGFAAMWAYVAWTRRRGRGRYLLALGLFGASLMSKPMFVTLPFLLLLLDYWPLGRIDGRPAPAPKGRVARRPRRPAVSLGTLMAEKLPFFALSIASGIVTIAAQQAEGSMVYGELVPLRLRLANAAVAYVRYLGKLVWPHDLAVLYPHPALPGGTPLVAWQITGAVLVLVTITAAAVATRGRGYPLVGWLWYAIMLVPVSGIVQVGEQAMADRYTYVPLIGPLVVIAWGGADLVARWRGARPGASPGSAGSTVAGPQMAPALDLLVGGLAAAIVLAGAAGAWWQCRHWRDSTALFEHSLAAAPEPAVVHNNLGIAYQFDGRPEAAVHQYQEAVRVNPDYAPAFANLGALLARHGRRDEAAAFYRRALIADPRYAPAHTDLGRILAGAGETEAALQHFRLAIEANPRFAQAYLQLGATLAAVGNQDAALVEYRKAVQVAPQLASAQAALAVALQTRGEVDEAIEHYRAALALDPDDVDLRGNLGYAFYSRGDLGAAITEYERALAARPDDPKVHNNFCIALLAQGRTDEAIEQCRAAVTVRPDYAIAHNNLGSALVNGGDLDAAIHHFREAVRLDPGYAQARANLARAEETSTAAAPSGGGP